MSYMGGKQKQKRDYISGILVFLSFVLAGCWLEKVKQTKTKTAS